MLRRASKVYAIDVEGGKATLYVSPSGQSMLLDAGYAGNGDRDANRIAAATRDGGREAGSITWWPPTIMRITWAA